MDKNLKSLLNSLAIILIFLYATAGFLKLFWNTPDENRFEARVKFLTLLLFIISILYVIGIYHIVGPYKVEPFYWVFIILSIAYLVIGIVANMFIKNK
jgi:hypothetical membrane protein